GNLIQGNYIGTDINGTAALGNAGAGIQLFTFVQPTGVNTVAGNIISSNGGDGIVSYTNNFLIQGNYIGTDVNGTADLGNGNNGIEVTASATNNMIGGAAAGAGNTIAFNGKNTNASNGDGVHIDDGSTGNSILGNSI